MSKKTSESKFRFITIAPFFLIAVAAVIYLNFGALFNGTNQAAAVDKAKVENQLRGSTQNGDYLFYVELAGNEAERSQGLMHRISMADDHGMLFRFDETQLVRMWMKNTPLSLDMIFIDEAGVIRHIARNTIPQSTNIISSREPVRFVLEINAGMGEKLGIKRGQKLSHPWFQGQGN